MAWLKGSDTSYDHPAVIAPLAWDAEDLDGMEPHDLMCVLYGMVWRCATYCAQKGRDYQVPDSLVSMMIGNNYRARAAQAEKAGYWTRSAAGDGWQLLDDAEHLFHIRRKAEIDWEKARKVDISNPALVVPVRLRDGDGCRYCGHIVQWTARRGNRAGTYDHRRPGEPATGPDDLVVACGLCNRTRSNNPDAQAWPLRPAPADPYYGPHTMQFLSGYGHHVQQSDPAARGATPGDPAPSEATPARPQRAPAPWKPADLQISVDPTGRGYPLDRTPGRVAGTGRKRGRRGRRGGARRRTDPGEGR